ncbi:MAG: hypothetical protein DWI10_05145 [Planctomycetota bacterium]|nr:MAG: hypothetical protein DWI10_05145 [Planctomycetota bacterium]
MAGLATSERGARLKRRIKCSDRLAWHEQPFGSIEDIRYNPRPIVGHSMAFDVRVDLSVDL